MKSFPLVLSSLFITAAAFAEEAAAAVVPAATEVAAHAAAPDNNAILQIAGQFGIKPHLLLAQIVNFAIVAAILYFFVIKPLQKSLDTRAATIDEGLKRAEEAAKTLEAAKTERDAIIAGARKEVQTLVERTQKEMTAFETQTRTQTQRETQEMLDKAKRDMIAQQEQQISKAQKELAAIVVSLAEKSLEETLTPDQKTRFSEKVAQNLK